MKFLHLLLLSAGLSLGLDHVDADKPIIYQSQNERSTEEVAAHGKTDECASRYLSLRDIPALTTKYVLGPRALDYGSGNGITADFLQKLGFCVTGVDINDEMLQHARHRFSTIDFYAVAKGSLPFSSRSYDLVFSSFVLVEIGTKEEMVAYFQEAARVLDINGIVMAVTIAEDAYSHDWFVFKTDFPENRELTSGGLAKAYLPDVNIEFTNFYWTEADHCEAMERAGLVVKEIHYPLGKEDEGYSWKEERYHSPFVVIIAGKPHRNNSQDKVDRFSS